MSNTSKLEFLPNELIIKCLDYLNPYEIFHAFDQLNYRFNRLLRAIPLHLRFHSISKTIFDDFCTKIVLNPTIKNQIISIKTSTADEYLPCSLFLSYFSLHEFPRLQEFHTIFPEKSETGDDFWSTPCIYPNPNLADHRLSNLRRLSIPTITNIYFVTHLTISRCVIKELYQFMSDIPVLEYLHIKVLSANRSKKLVDHISGRCFPLLKRLSIEILDVIYSIFEVLIKQTPNLKYLMISTRNDQVYIDANRWEYLIKSSLISLETFKFKFICSFYVEQQAILLERFQQFQTRFWLQEHHWYTEYITEKDSVVIYTIPYISTSYELTSSTKRYSSRRNNPFTKVTDLTLSTEVLANECDEYFSNVRSLTLIRDMSQSFPVSTSLQSLKKIIHLSNLEHIDICNSTDTEYRSWILELFKEGEKISSMDIDPYSLRSFLCDGNLHIYLNKMIKRLNITAYCRFLTDNLEGEQFCEIFSNLEHLQLIINVEDDLFFLIDHLSKLSTFKVTWASGSNHEEYLPQFRNQVQKRNLVYNITVDYDAEYSDLDDSPCNHCETIVFIWLGKTPLL